MPVYLSKVKSPMFSSVQEGAVSYLFCFLPALVAIQMIASYFSIAPFLRTHSDYMNESANAMQDWVDSY